MGKIPPIVVLGKPIAKKRPRFARRGKFVVTYNDQQTEEGRFLFEVQKQWNRMPLLGAIKIDLRFFMPIPASTSKKQTALMEGGAVPHTKKPDIDNLIKFVLDCLNGVVFNDDSQIVKISGSKVYHPYPGTEILLDFVEHKAGE